MEVPRFHELDERERLVLRPSPQRPCVIHPLGHPPRARLRALHRLREVGLEQPRDPARQRAFAELVSRHINLVYSTALRIVRDSELAEDVSQSVFIQLARKAPAIQCGNALAGWLYRVTRCQAANAVRDDRSRRERETEAMNMTRTNDESSVEWESILPHLDEAMNTLGDEDQNAVLQRFFQGRSWREVGAAMAVSEDAAQKRVSRALDKLRSHFIRRGVVASSGALALAIAANAVHAAPSGLASAVTTTSLIGTGIGGSADATSASSSRRAGVTPPATTRRAGGRPLSLSLSSMSRAGVTTWKTPCPPGG